MSALEVLTVTYAPDLELFEDLHASVLRYTGDDVTHRVVISDDADLPLFRRFASRRCEVLGVGQVLPSSFVKVPGRNMLLNLRRPWPPVRGWVVQQMVKLAMTARSESDLVLLMDSDVALVRPVDVSTFQTDGLPHFFRMPGAVHAGMPRHVRWHQVAREMLGLPTEAVPPLSDYVDAFNLWSPASLRGLRDHVERSTGRSWLTAFASNLHVSEFVLYGVYIDQVLGEAAPVHAVQRMRCHNYWDETPLDRQAARDFVDRARADDVAVMISSKSGTDIAVRREALARLA